MTKSSYLILGGLIVLAGCQTVGNTDDVPALVTNPTAASRAALQRAVNDFLNMDVTITDDALTSSNMLIIERNPPTGMQNQVATGRNMDPAIQFRLVLNGTDCILVDTRDDSRRVLEDTTCAAE
jgi:hypothetical protein